MGMEMEGSVEAACQFTRRHRETPLRYTQTKCRVSEIGIGLEISLESIEYVHASGRAV